MKIFLLFFLSFLFTAPVFAKGAAVNERNALLMVDPSNPSLAIKMPKDNQPCWDEAANYYKVDPWLLYAIASVESDFNHQAVNVNKRKNGTVKSIDFGLMQINSYWYPTLSKFGIYKTHLRNACVSTFVGAWILSQNFKSYGYSWVSVGAYNTGNPKTGKKYARKVYRAYQRLVKEYASAAADKNAK